ncbi:glu leu phe val dehydrogenase family [Fusarium napiforme]|uniref:Glu leu phe val dehydrogenase family n=1 Tax=Fusarium napiforme TaxID=42672 RepID=A0A8H5JMK4_9HYPO|nr:glu leu phe val dehydrogenase family [Fusarium napiforme]
MSTRPNDQQDGSHHEVTPDNGPLSEAKRLRVEELELTFAKAKHDLEIFCRENRETSSLLTPDALSGGSDLKQAPSADADGGCCPSCGRGTSDIGPENLPDNAPIPVALLSSVFKVRNEAGEVATKYINGYFYSGNHPEWFAINPHHGLIGAVIHGSIDRLAERIRKDKGCTRVFFSLNADLPEEFDRIWRNEGRGPDFVTDEPLERAASGSVLTVTHIPFLDDTPSVIGHGRCFWHWEDQLSEAQGWIVIDSPVPTPSGGILFLHEPTTLNEVRNVAQSMSLKLAVSCQPQVVGAKGGIRFSPQHPQVPHVLERFIRDNPVSSLGTTTALVALRNSLGCGSPAEVAALLKESFNANGWSLEEYCVGYVMATTLKELLAHQRPDLIGKVRLMIQGFGCVGTTFALAAEELGIGRVVGISSQYGFLINDDGIDCGAIDRARRMAVNNGSPQGYDARSFEAGLGQVGLHVTREIGSTDEKHLINFLACVRGEIFVPCAQRYVLTSRVISTLADETFVHAPLGTRFIIAGANNVFSQRDSVEDVARRLDSASIYMLPEWVTNSGIVKHRLRNRQRISLPVLPMYWVLLSAPRSK